MKLENEKKAGEKRKKKKKVVMIELNHKSIQINSSSSQAGLRY